MLYDVVVVGLGPSAVSSAIYSARKGLKVAVIGRSLGGQILETNEIENIIGIPKTTGLEFASKLKEHINEYDMHINDKAYVNKIENLGNIKKVYTTNNEIYETKTIIIATGAIWRKLNIDGEKEYTGKGVHYCATCDGPFYKGLDVTVIGGGNSGVEAALDLSNIAKKVTLIEYMDTLKADKVLQDKLYLANNIDVKLNVECKKVKGDDFVTSLVYKDRKTNDEFELNTDGIFVEIGLVANTEFTSDILKLNERKEIIIDEKNMTNVEGIFAAGDCTNTLHKQVIIAMGEGAKAALSAFNYILNN